MAVTIKGSQTYESGSGGYNASHTLTDLNASGTDTLAVAAGFNRNPASDVTSWTFESNTPTLISNSINANVAAVSTYRYLINNSATTIVSNTPSYKLQAMIGVALEGVDQTTPITGTPVTAGTYSATGTASYTGTAGNMLLVFVSTQNDKTFTASGVTTIASITHADGNLGSGYAGYVEATGSAQTIGATWTGSDNWRLVIFEVKAASGTSLVVPDSLYSATLDNVALTQANTLALADSLYSSTVDNIALTQANTLVVADMTSSTTVDNTVLTTDIPLVVADMTSSVTLDSTVLTQANTLAVADFLSSVTLDNTVLTQANTLVVQDSLSSTVVDNIALGLTSIISITSFTAGTLTVDNPQTFTHNSPVGTNTLLIVMAATDDLGNDSFNAVSYGGEALTEIHTQAGGGKSVGAWYKIAPLTGNNTVSGSLTGSVTRGYLAAYTLEGVHQTTPIDLHAVNTASTTSPTVSITTTVADAMLIDVFESDQTIADKISANSPQTERNVQTSSDTFGTSNKLVTTATTYTMSWTDVDNDENSYSLVVAVEPASDSSIRLVVADLTSSSTLDNVALTQQNTLALADSLSSSTLDNVALTQVHTLVVADSLSSIIVDNIELSTGTPLIVQDSTSSTTIDAVALTQANTLVVQDSTSSVTLDNTALTQANTLVVQDSLSSTTLDNVELTQAITLTVADMTSSVIVDNTVLTQAHTLVVAELLSSSTVDNLSLTQANTLVVAESLFSTTVDNVELTSGTPLEVADSTYSVTLDNVALTQANTLVVQDMNSSTTVDNTSLTQAYNLAVADLISSITVSNIVLETTELILFVNDLSLQTSLENLVLGNSIVNNILSGNKGSSRNINGIKNVNSISGTNNANALTGCKNDVAIDGTTQDVISI